MVQLAPMRLMAPVSGVSLPTSNLVEIEKYLITLGELHVTGCISEAECKKRTNNANHVEISQLMNLN